jgi:hypothetical protein
MWCFYGRMATSRLIHCLSQSSSGGLLRYVGWWYVQCLAVIAKRTLPNVEPVGIDSDPFKE